MQKEKARTDADIEMKSVEENESDMGRSGSQAD